MLQSISQWNWLKKVFPSCDVQQVLHSVTPCASLRQPVMQQQVEKPQSTNMPLFDRVWDTISCFSVAKKTLSSESAELRDFQLISGSFLTGRWASRVLDIQIVPCLIFKVWHVFCSCSRFSWECWNMWNGLQQPQANKYKLILQLL